MNELALFAGAGGGILGGKLLGWRTVCAIEWESYPASVLCARQNDGLLLPFPIWDDVQTFDGKPWAGIVDVVSGGFPCQDISAAGKGAGIDGERSGMWGEMARIIHEVRPRFVFVENSPMLTSRGLGRVLGDLATMGFDARWGVLGAADVGANHQRDRIWIVAKWRGQLSHTQHNRIRRWEQQQESLKETHGNVANTKELLGNGFNDNFRICLERQAQSQLGDDSRAETLANARCKLWSEGNSGIVDTQKEIGTLSPIFNQPSGQGFGKIPDSECVGRTERATVKRVVRQENQADISSHSHQALCADSPEWWSTEPRVGRVAHGVDARVDRLKSIGNGQVPLCAATAWSILNDF